MIERKFIKEKIKEFQIGEYISTTLRNVGHSHTKLQRTPLGDKIVIYASRPGLIVGRSGENIKKLTRNTKKKFNLDNPRIEISEVENIYLDAKIVAERIASSLERFGPQRFKGIGYKMMSEVMKSGGRGVEILISGKIPGSRAKTWRFYNGYLKKCGDLAVEGMRVGYSQALLKTGTVGIQVRIFPPDIRLPDHIIEKDPEAEAAKLAEEEAKKAEKKKPKKKRKKSAKRVAKKKSELPQADPEAKPAVQLEKPAAPEKPAKSDDAKTSNVEEKKTQVENKPEVKPEQPRAEVKTEKPAEVKPEQPETEESKTEEKTEQ